MRPARDEPGLPWDSLQPARCHHNPPPGRLSFFWPWILLDNIHVYQSQGATKICLLIVQNPGGVAELDDQPAADQPLLLQPPRLLLGNRAALPLAIRQRSVSRLLKVLQIYWNGEGRRSSAVKAKVEKGSINPIGCNGKENSFCGKLCFHPSPRSRSGLCLYGNHIPSVRCLKPPR